MKILFIGDCLTSVDILVGKFPTGETRVMLEILNDEAGIAKEELIYTNMVNYYTPNLTKETIQKGNKELIAFVNKTRPDRIVFMGEIVFRFCKDTFPEAITITHPAMLYKNGGKRAFSYRDCVLKLAGLLA